MRSLLLVAASGLAREVLATERLVGRYDGYRVLDDDPRMHGADLDGAPVLGPLEAVLDRPDDDLVLCVGRGRGRRALAERLAALGVTPDRYARVVHPGAHVPAGSVLGEGTVLLAGVTLTADVAVGRHVVAMPQVTLTHDDVIADFVTLCAGVSLGGHVRVGEAAYLGMNSCVREGLTVGAGATLGMGAALLSALPSAQTWAGVPARPIHHESWENDREGSAGRPGVAAG